MILKTRYLLFYCLVIFSCSQAVAQGTWTWMSGSSTPILVGNFGIQGVPAPTNQPAGTYEAAEWTDLNGNFWIFGGVNGLGVESALWKYTVSTGLWTWVKGPSTLNATGVYGIQGVPSPLNYPGARGWGSATWTDLYGDLWLFAGNGIDALGNIGCLNDLWKYTIATNEWTWMRGANSTLSVGSFGTQQISSSTNEPSARNECCATWSDNNGSLWLFGGSNNLSLPFVQSDDMWQYNIFTNQWTWMSGQQSGFISPNWGTIMVPSINNTPGSRMIYAHWQDKLGNFWIFGGNDNIGFPNRSFADMWKYDPVTNLWTWMAGSSTPNTGTTFTQQCQQGNGIPGAIYENRACWTDQCGRFWMFGGALDVAFQSVYNTLTIFDPITLQFTWINGSLMANQVGNFGIQNVASPSNTPPSLSGSNGFLASNGEFWLFAGESNAMHYNTLWRYQIDPNCPLTPTADFVPQPDSMGCAPYAAQFIPLTTTAVSYHWDFGDALTLADTSNQDTTSWTFNQAGDYAVTLILDGGCELDTSSVTIRVADPPTIDLGADTIICAGQTIALTTTMPGSYIWNTGDTTASILVNTAGQYSIQITTDTFNCVVNDTVNITVTPLPIPNLGNDTAICTGQTVLLNPGTFDAYQWNTGDTTATLIANAQGNYSVQVELNNCFNFDTIAIRVDEEPTIGVGTDSVRCNIVLDAGNPGASYQWNTGETTQTITATQTGTYSVTITNGACMVVDSIIITGELGGGLLYIPNAFTPDQNGINEKFQPVGTNIVGFSMAIYDRWGELVYETNDITKGWDGRRNGNLVQQDVYVYSISYTSDCLDGKQVRKIGRVTVLR